MLAMCATSASTQQCGVATLEPPVSSYIKACDIQPVEHESDTTEDPNLNFKNQLWNEALTRALGVIESPEIEEKRQLKQEQKSRANVNAALQNWCSYAKLPLAGIELPEERRSATPVAENLNVELYKEAILMLPVLLPVDVRTQLPDPATTISQLLVHSDPGLAEACSHTLQRLLVKLPAQRPQILQGIVSLMISCNESNTASLKTYMSQALLLLDTWALKNAQERVEEAKGTDDKAAMHALAHMSEIQPDLSTVKEVRVLRRLRVDLLD